MLYDAIVKIKLPGNDEANAGERLARCIPHWPFEILEIAPAAEQPPRIVGTGNIVMPLVGSKGG